MSRSVRYGFITSSRSRAPSICSRIACEAATKPPGITWASAIGVEPASAGSGKYGERSAGSGPPWPRKLVRNAACACRTTSPVTRTITSWKPPFSKWSSMPGAARPRDGAVDRRRACGGRRGRPRPGASRACWSSGKRPSRSSGNTSLTTICAPAAASRVNISRASPYGLRAEAVDDHPHLDALRQLPLQQRGHPHPDLALAPAEHEDVHRRARGLDVGEDAREEVRALDPRLDRRRRRPREVERRVVRPRPAARGERLGRGLRARRTSPHRAAAASSAAA